MRAALKGLRRRGRTRSTQKRDAMLDAARVEFGNTGYRDTTMDAIARRAQVSKRTLYNHFATKEGVFLVVMKESIEVISRALTLHYLPGESVRMQLESRARATIQLVRDPVNLRLFRAILAEHIRNPGLVEKVLTSHWESECGIADWIEAAHRDGRLRVHDPRHAAHIFQSLIRGLITWPVILSRQEFTSDRLTAALEEALDMFLAFYSTDSRDMRARPAGD